ncbi:methionyl-tRNA formyltransferase [Aphanomyces invadans]|uniref:Methionyl-tRNA formyltransferase, mitochondrial n=1 Tax=Aphanomyces invadans TaxID=157072 RepID=A0A024UI16_9STRA|nr:methionyl-tRNA formyltransferase [Aphanomyces invadans]ETW05507.1 methionyl-tRNA formyltransferase [Aphanomyces invadans]|eukprot:XP_008865284.1 methionyl-tRNA formyltransferase [Aphanomyces invadans]
MADTSSIQLDALSVVHAVVLVLVGYACLQLGLLVLDGSFMHLLLSEGRIVVAPLSKRIQSHGLSDAVKFRSSVHTSTTIRLPVATTVQPGQLTALPSLPHDIPMVQSAVAPPTGLRVLFFGTDAISLATLELLHANMQPRLPHLPPLIHSIEVVCPTDKRVARTRSIAPVPVKQFALDNHLPIHHVPDNAKARRQWTVPPPATGSAFDIAVVVSFGYFIHPPMLANVAKGAINMHPSILPKYRGPAPIPRALYHGDKATGISIIEIDPRAFDVGRILYCDDTIAIPDTATLPELSKRLASRGAECVLHTLRDIDTLFQHARPQDEASATAAPKMRREDGIVLWTETAAQLYNMWRAVGASYGVVASLGGKAIKFIEMHRPNMDAAVAFETRVAASVPAAAGMCWYDKATKGLWIQAADREWIVVLRVQVANRAVRTASEFADGQRVRPLQPFRFDQNDVVDAASRSVRCN